MIRTGMHGNGMRIPNNGIRLHNKANRRRSPMQENQQVGEVKETDAYSRVMARFSMIRCTSSGDGAPV